MYTESKILYKNSVEKQSLIVNLEKTIYDDIQQKKK